MTVSLLWRACPTWHRKARGIDAAGFIFVVEDCERGSDGRNTMTEIFGFFQPTGARGGDVQGTASLVVPIGSPIAVMAHQVNHDRRGKSPLRVAAILLKKLDQCGCAQPECPALDELSLVEAIEFALAGRWP